MICSVIFSVVKAGFIVVMVLTMFEGEAFGFIFSPND